MSGSFCSNRVKVGVYLLLLGQIGFGYAQTEPAAVNATDNAVTTVTKEQVAAEMAAQVKASADKPATTDKPASVDKAASEDKKAINEDKTAASEDKKAISEDKKAISEDKKTAQEIKSSTQEDNKKAAADPVAKQGAQPAATPDVQNGTENGGEDSRATQPENPEKLADTAEKPVAAKLPKAISVELDEPVEVKKVTLGPEPVTEEAPVVSAKVVAAPQLTHKKSAEPERKALVILNTEVSPSTTTRLSWSPDESFELVSTPTPVLIAHGAKPGPILCLTAALHGDELNGIEIVRRVLYNLDPATLSGSVIGVPIVNLQGFQRSSRYLVDRRDLNRYFPGNSNGSSASRIAHSFFTEVISHCNALVDLHTGSFYRTNLPQLRGDVRNPKVVKLTQSFGATLVLQSKGAKGTLRRAAVESGIPAVTLEAGESMRLQERAVVHGVKGIQTLMNHMGMVEKPFSLWGDPEPIYYKSIWVRAERGGILFGNVSLGDKVTDGSLLGEVRDPITNTKTKIYSPKEGRIIGMAVNQVVQPGFAAFHIGIRADDDSIPNAAEDIEASETSGFSDSVETTTATIPAATESSKSPTSSTMQYAEQEADSDNTESAIQRATKSAEVNSAPESEPHRSHSGSAETFDYD